jgi:hypothetical protein
MSYREVWPCHSREGGNPGTYRVILDPRLRGGDMTKHVVWVLNPRVASTEISEWIKKQF